MPSMVPGALVYRVLRAEVDQKNPPPSRIPVDRWESTVAEVQKIVDGLGGGREVFYVNEPPHECWRKMDILAVQGHGLDIVLESFLELGDVPFLDMRI